MLSTKSTTRRRPRVRPSGPATARRERQLLKQGYRTIAGLDEAGRGSWFGPLVAAAVILPINSRRVVARLHGLTDSKRLSRAQRESYYEQLQDSALGIGLGVVTAAVLDQLGLSAAGRLAMERAVRNLPSWPDFLLIDAFPLPNVECPQEAIIFGDGLCLSIAAASVVAKVERDRMVTELAERYPGYGFERNMGYGTGEHARALRELGQTDEHRCSYAPLRAMLNGNEGSLPP